MVSKLVNGVRVELTGPEEAELAALAVDVTAFTPNIVSFSDFIGRWNNAEYLALMRARAAAITAGQITFVKAWDTEAARGMVNLSSTGAQTFKAALVAANLLTQQRADVIFS